MAKHLMALYVAMPPSMMPSGVMPQLLGSFLMGPRHADLAFGPKYQSLCPSCFVILIFLGKERRRREGDCYVVLHVQI